MNLYGMKIIDWSGIKDVPEDQRKEKILEAATDFMKRVSKLPIGNVKMNGADPTLTGDDNPIAFRLTDTAKTPDRGYEKLFDEVDMRQSTSKSFDLLDVKGGVTFYQQLPGEEAKLSKLPSADKAFVSMLRFTGGFSILDDWLRFNEYYKIDALIADTIRRWYDKKASLHYMLLKSLGNEVNQSFDTDDIVTINNACVHIQTGLAKLGYAIAENPSFYLTVHPNLKMRIFKALVSAFLNSNNNTSKSQLVWDIKGVISTVKIPADSYYVSLPGGKNMRGEWDDLNARPAQRNELVLGADHVWTGAYNAVIGEPLQHRRCMLSK
ncbi:MAG: hypothetical protein GY874_14315 [Desulfobacteraceae bacterium]|nr:hypothetical protein [Desulfobacteraceae bacterium]